MRPIEQEAAQSGIGLNDILFILFRHKWKILLCALAGLAAAAAVYYYSGRVYESRAKILVLYVMEQSTKDPGDAQVRIVANQLDTIMSAEVEILTSSDLAIKVVNTVGVDRLVPQFRGADAEAAAVRSVILGIRVIPQKGSNVITVAYRNRDPELARTVLTELVNLYYKKHQEVHGSGGALEAVNTASLTVGNRLAKTEAELTKLKKEAEILSFSDSISSVNARLTKGEDDLLAAEAEFAEQQARLKETERLMGGGEASSPKSGTDEAATAPPAVKPADVQRYQLLVERIAALGKTEMEYLSKYTSDSKLVKSVQSQIADLERERNDLEKKFPALLSTVPKTVAPGSSQPDLVSASANLAAIAARVETLKSQLRGTQERALLLSQLAPRIAELERMKEVDEASFKYLESNREKARVDAARDHPNLSPVQTPSFGARVAGENQKLLMGLAGGGIALGIGLALLIELVLNRSISRPLELETRLRIPQMLSIPFLPGHSRVPRLAIQDRPSGGEPQKALKKISRAEIAPWDPNHFIRSFSEEIRDRLILWFQLKNLTHKPKLVGVAGLSGGEGTSTVAGGLAAALSETGDGKVLLVNMNSGTSEAYTFTDGNPPCGLAEALEANGSLPATADNLYLAIGSSENGGSKQLAAKRFYALVPTLKKCHFDYIIFDLPPVSQTSATLAIAGCLDKLLFVVEAGKSDRDEVKRAYSELVAAKAEVAGVLNKTRSSGPKWLNA